jgi:hypothetical protein
VEGSATDLAEDRSTGDLALALRVHGRATVRAR